MSLRSLFAICGLMVSFTVVPSVVSGLSVPNHSTKAATGATNSSTQNGTIRIVHAKELKGWIDTHKDIQIVDARTKKYDEGEVIAGAKFLPSDSADKKISKELPSKDATSVVYCASIKCPASENLAKRLISMGYTNIYRYPEGLSEWFDKNYPTTSPKS